MDYIIIRENGEALKDIDGKPILCATAREASRFVMPGERVVPLAKLPSSLGG
jgi:hypothetical protein